ncbi:MAG: alpha/beta hydrolase-fold protein [Candidatus Didemnitutus sp.]|nr:alpha/beta hydrolase-fold protein [Candidatus Didemnitutus sp.]
MNRSVPAPFARMLQTLGLGNTEHAAVELRNVSAPGLEPRTVRLYLPPGEVRADTPLLLAFDGQTLPHWHLAETISQLALERAIRAPLVVAVDATRDRIEEYAMAGQRDYAGRGNLAPAFQQLMVGRVLPAVRQRFGLVAAPARTGVFGASMGGLCAFDLAWRHPEIFGFGGVFSGSLWWRADNTDPVAQQASRLAHLMVRATVAKPPLRLWFQAGTKDETNDRDGNGVIDAIQDTTELIDDLVRNGFERGRDVRYLEQINGEHSERTWAEVLPQFLRWALPR